MILFRINKSSERKKPYKPRVCVVLFCVVSLVKYEKVYLLHFQECRLKAVAKYVCGTDDGHVVLEMLVPGSLTPRVNIHIAAKTLDLLVQVALEHSELLVD